MADEKKLVKAYERVEALQPVIDQAVEEVVGPLFAGTNVTLKDLIRAQNELMTLMAESLMEKIDQVESEAKTLRKAKTESDVKTAAAEKQAGEATDLKLPEGSMVVAGEHPEEMSVLVLRKVNTELLRRVIEALKAVLAGGTDDVRQHLMSVAQTRKTEFWSSETEGFVGYPVFGTAAVLAADASGRLTKNATPTEERAPLADLGAYLVKAAQVGKQTRVDLT